MKPGQVLKELRIKKGMTQEELADKTRMSVRSIQRIENGEVEPRAYSLRTLATALEADYESLNQRGNGTAASGDLPENITWLVALHLSGLFLLVLPTVLLWVWKKDSVKDFRQQGIDVINFQLNMLLIMVPCGLLAFLIITVPVLVLAGIFNTALILLNTIRILNRQPYYYPFLIKILKP